MASETAHRSCKVLYRGLQTLWIHTNSTTKQTHCLFSSRSYGNAGSNHSIFNPTFTYSIHKPPSPNCPSNPLQKVFAYDRRLLSTESLTEKWKSAALRLKQTVKQNLAVNFNAANAAQKIPKGLDKPLGAAKFNFSRYREAFGLQLEAFWRRNTLVLVGLLGFGLCILLWRIMFGIASTFVGLSEGIAKYGFLALATAIVAFAGLFLRARYTVNPDKVYRIAMRKLNTSAGILEVMGAPLSGTDVRAYIMSGGRIRLKNFKPTLSRKRCFLIFPISGSERRGLVSVEVKKKKGQIILWQVNAAILEFFLICLIFPRRCFSRKIPCRFWTESVIHKGLLIFHLRRVWRILTGGRYIHGKFGQINPKGNLLKPVS